MASNLEIFLPIWETASPSFQERIPQPSRDNFERIGVLISSDNYEAQRNEIFDALINLIGKQKVFQMTLNNPLSRVINRGTMRLGDTYQEMMSDIIEGHTFRIAKDDQFEKFPNIVKSAYHRVNREQYYPVTIEEAKLPRAFMQEGGLQRLVNSLVNQMYSSNELDEFQFLKQTIREYYTNTDVPILPTQTLEVPDVKSNLLDTSVINAFTMTVKGLMSQMRFPKSVYNPYEFTQQVNPSEFTMILDASVTTAKEVMTLATVFNPEFLDVNVPINAIDSFGNPGDPTDPMNEILGIVFHKDWLGALDTLRTLRTAENARNLYRNHFYHVHQLWYASTFVPVVFLKRESTQP